MGVVMNTLQEQGKMAYIVDRLELLQRANGNMHTLQADLTRAGTSVLVIKPSIDEMDVVSMKQVVNSTFIRGARGVIFNLYYELRRDGFGDVAQEILTRTDIKR